MSAVLEEVQKEKRILMLAPARHQLFQHTNNRHFVTAEEGTVIEDVLKPEFLAHVAAKFRMYDEVTVVTDDGAFWARLLVMQAGSTWVRTRLLESIDLKGEATPVAADPMNPYEVAFKGPVRKWVCFRKSDGHTVTEGMASRNEAERFMSDYLRKTTGG